MENRSHALTTGLFTIALLIAAVLFGVWFNRDKTERVPYMLATTLSVPGLNPQAAVRYRGLEVGKVNSIDFDPKVAGQILVQLSVDPDTPVTRSTFAMLGYQGVTGIAYVQLDDASIGSPRLATSAAQPARIELRPGLLDQLEKRGKVLLDQADEVTHKVNALLSPENQKAMIGAFQDISKAANAYAALPAELEPTLAKLPALAAQTQQTLTQFSTFTNNANQLVTTWDKLGTSLQAPGGTVDQVNRMVDRVGMSVQGVSSTVELDLLPHVTELSEETGSSMRTLKRTMDNLNERPQSILFGAPTVPPGPGEAGFVAPTK